jgi:phosphopentomutase
MLFWLALAFLVVAVVGSVAYAVVKGIELWRAVKQLGRVTADELDRIARASGEIELHLQAAAASGTRLEASVAELHRSRARLNVLTSALADARAAVGRFTSVVPRK